MSLAARSVSVRLGGRLILDDVSLICDSQQTTALIGPNGAGKSTLLRTLAGEIGASDGEVLVDRLPITQLSAVALAGRRAVMTQSSEIVFDFTVEEVLSLGMISDRLRPAERQAAIERVARDSDIRHLQSRSYNTLSGGEKQRVQFARALLQIRPAAGDDTDQAPYLLLDEPTSSLDLSHELMLLEAVTREASRGVGVLIVIHDLNLAARFADQIALMQDGRIMAVGAPQEVLDNQRLSDVYRTPVRVEHHQDLDRLVVYT
ncbi:MAG: heme ABC transporter ATP-binding protein [Pseudomonadota bacterium]